MTQVPIDRPEQEHPHDGAAAGHPMHGGQEDGVQQAPDGGPHDDGAQGAADPGADAQGAESQEGGTQGADSQDADLQDGARQGGDDEDEDEPTAGADAADRLLVDMVVAAPVDVVWAALRDPDRIRRWFGWDDPGLDAEIRQIFLDEAVPDDDARTLTWKDGDRIELAEDDGGGPTHLRLTRRGHVEDWWDGVHDLVDEGWITFTQQLRFLLERHPDDERRTVYATDVDLGPDDDALLDRLGLRPLGDEAVGSRYTVTRPDGSTFGGEIVFQTDLQIGLSVDDEDDALLVVARRPPASAPPHGTAVFLLSLFGDTATDEGRLAAAEQRWRGWWGG